MIRRERPGGGCLLEAPHQRGVALGRPASISGASPMHGSWAFIRS